MSAARPASQAATPYTKKRAKWDRRGRSRQSGPGVSTSKKSRALWPKAEEFGFNPARMEAFGLQFGHGLGMALHERPIISRLGLRSSTRSKLKEGHGPSRLENLLPGERRPIRRARIEEGKSSSKPQTGAKVITLFSFFFPPRSCSLPTDISQREMTMAKRAKSLGLALARAAWATRSPSGLIRAGHDCYGSINRDAREGRAPSPALGAKLADFRPAALRGIATSSSPSLPSRTIFVAG